jgi:hypothetical protein
MKTTTWVAFCLLLLAALGVHAETRVALVIGNGAYASSPLANAVSDAQLLRDTLKADGFTVIYLENADRGQMVRAIQALGQQLTAEGKYAVGLFYFSGHGVQSRDGHNFLLPVKGHFASEADLFPEAVDADWVLKQMEEVHNHLNILVLDACRDNPLPASARSERRGLARMVAPIGSVVAYATDAGTVAYDDNGAHHSPYAAALAHAMQHPGLELKAMFDEVASSVYNATQNEQPPQVPVMIYKLVPNFYFRAAALTSPQTPQPAPDRELALWQSAERLGTAEAYRAYLAQFPNGQFSNMAQLQLAALTRSAWPAQGSSSSPSSSASSSSSLGISRGARLWVYPRNGQTDEETRKDRSECHTWAAGQTANDSVVFYQRAISACLDARGYSTSFGD